MYKWMALTLILVGLAALGVFAVSPAALSVTPMQSPAAAGSLAPNLSVAADGRVLLSWLEPVTPKGYALRFSMREKQAWTAPRTITSGTDWFVSGADYPTVAFMADGTMAANSLIATNLQAEAYNTNVFFSRDSGATWTKPVSLHRDKKQRQHGFVSFVPTSDGGLGAVWLDGRNLSNTNEGDMSLLYTTIGKDGAIKSETTLDKRACECCQTSAVATAEGLLVVYRDRSPKEIRDIYAVRYINGKWSSPSPVANDGWENYSCPVNGPAVSASGRNAAVAWVTGDKPIVNVALSSDAGKTFAKPIRVDDGNGRGRVDIVSLASGAAVVSWVERAGDRSEVRIRQIEASGSVGKALTVSGETDVPRDSFPRIERSGNDLFVTWTTPGDTPTVRTAVVNLQ